MKKEVSKIILCFFCLIQIFSIQIVHAQNCWSPLGSGCNGYINAMGNYNGSLIAGGHFDSIGGIAVANIAAWNGSSWSTLGSGLKIDIAHSTELYIAGMQEFNGELYVVGQFDTAGGTPVHNVAKWNGLSWSDVGGGPLGKSYTAKALAFYNGSLYVGGSFDTAGIIPAKGIAKWDGSSWSAVDSGLSDISHSPVVYCLCVYNNTLCVGGSFAKAGAIPANNIAAWNDTAWSALGSGVATNLLGGVSSIAYNQGILYAAAFGYYYDSLDAWDGYVWSKGTSIHPKNNNIGIDALASFNGKLIAGGGFDSINGVSVNNLAQWDGYNWSPLADVVGFYYTEVDWLINYNGHLIICGDFLKVDSTIVNGIAEYTCTTNGINNIATNTIKIYPNPTTGILHISMDNISPNSSIQIYDLMGQKVMESTILNTNTEMDLSGKPSGIYLYRMTDHSGHNISSGNIILE